jgi:hypothetical protein
MQAKFDEAKFDEAKFDEAKPKRNITGTRPARPESDADDGLRAPCYSIGTASRAINCATSSNRSAS